MELAGILQRQPSGTAGFILVRYKSHSDTRRQDHFDFLIKTRVNSGGNLCETGPDEDGDMNLECAGIEQRVNDFFQGWIDSI